MIQQQRYNNNDTAATIQQQQRYNTNDITTTIQQRRYNNNDTTTTIQQQRYNNSDITPTIQHSHSPDRTSTQQCINNTITTHNLTSIAAISVVGFVFERHFYHRAVGLGKAFGRSLNTVHITVS